MLLNESAGATTMTHRPFSCDLVEHTHLSHFITQGTAEKGQDDMEHPSLGTQLIALFVSNPLPQNSKHPFLFSFLLTQKKKVSLSWSPFIGQPTLQVAYHCFQVMAKLTRQLGPYTIKSLDLIFDSIFRSGNKNQVKFNIKMCLTRAHVIYKGI